MNKRTVIHSTVSGLSAILLGLFLTSACSSTSFYRWQQPSVAVQQAIASDLANALDLQRASPTMPIVLKPIPDFPAFHNALLEELRTKGILAGPQDGLTAELSPDVHVVDAYTLKVALALDGEVLLDRMYRAEPVPTRQAATHITHVRQDSKPNSILQNASTSTDYRQTVGLAPKRDFEQVASVNPAKAIHQETLPQKTPEAKCAGKSLNAGSLKANITRILKECGWTLVAWPLDPTNPPNELDWIVPHAQPLVTQSIEALVELLEQSFVVSADLDADAKTVSISLRV